MNPVSRQAGENVTVGTCWLHTAGIYYSVLPLVRGHLPSSNTTPYIFVLVGECLFPVHCSGFLSHTEILKIKTLIFNKLSIVKERASLPM